MTSFTLSGSPWFLLLLVPGAFILWRQYRGRRGGGPRGSALLALQAAALLILVVSLTGPELARRHAEFRDPAVTL
ncbi:MAG TPA: hypothetical protein VK465_03610, partial [Fibrobacteria bacterium]|nr:hypothetical protein [Fibrobacteria bacterium]